MKKLIPFILAVLVILVALVLTRDPSSPPADQESGSADMTVEEGEGREIVSEPVVREFTFEARNFSFSRNEITVSRGEKVRIVLDVMEGLHDWRLEGYDIGTRQIGAGRQEVLEFTADEAGTFAFYCSVGNHRQLGMEGRLIVTE